MSKHLVERLGTYEQIGSRLYRWECGCIGFPLVPANTGIPSPVVPGKRQEAAVLAPCADHRLRFADEEEGGDGVLLAGMGSKHCEPLGTQEMVHLLAWLNNVKRART